MTRLRSEIFPELLGDSPANAHVGGQTANFADLGNRVADRLPCLVNRRGRSVVPAVDRRLPAGRGALEAALLNLPGIAAAYAFS